MQLSLLLMISCVGGHLAAAAPEHKIGPLQNSANLEHTERDPNLLKFVHKLLHTLQNGYQDPNWPSNLQQRTQPTLSNDCSEEESQSVEHECDDDSDYADEITKLKRVKVHEGSYGHDPDHVCEEVCFCESYEQSKPSTKLQKAMKESPKSHRNEKVYIESSKCDITKLGLEHLKPKIMTDSQNIHPATTPQQKSEERRATQELLYKRLSDLHLPRIQINQFGMNKVEQKLCPQIKGLGSMNKNQRDDMQKTYAGHTKIHNVQPQKVGSGKFSGYDDEDEEQHDHQEGNTERTWPIVSNKNTKNKSHSKQDSSEPKEYRRHDESPIITATQNNIKYSDIDIEVGRDRNFQGKINEQPKPTILHVVPDQPNTANFSKVAEQSKVVGNPKVTHQPRVPDLPEVPNHPKVSHQPKVPDQPKIIIDDITEGTTEHTQNYGFTTAEDLTTEADMMDTKITEKEKNITTAIYITPIPALDDSKKIEAEDSQRLKRTQDTTRNKSRRNGAGIITPTSGTPRDQEADGTYYYPLNLNEGGHEHNRLNSVWHGVPIAYESKPRASASHFYSDYYNSGIQTGSPKSPFLREPTDRFATIPHDMDFDDYGGYDTQVLYPTQYHINAPAANVYWSSIYKPRHGKPVRNSLDSAYRYAKQPRFEAPQSLFEHADFVDPELTAGWEDWEPSYNNDMLHDRSYLRPVPRDLNSYNRYFT